jgi:aldehyde dehydrogenase (NAD+)
MSSSRTTAHLPAALADTSGSRLLDLLKTVPDPRARRGRRHDLASVFAVATLPFGNGSVNQTILHLFFSNLPFGGIGASGIGQYLGKTGFDSLTHDKSILFSPADEVVDSVFPPYDAETPNRIARMFD